MSDATAVDRILAEVRAAAANGGAHESARETAPNGSEEPGPRTTWWPRPIGLDREPPPAPTLLCRTDGVGLLYAGRLNALVGESESCKTWCAYVAAAEVVRDGGHVVVVDFEDSEATAEGRLVALGLTLDAVQSQVHFLHPEEPLLDPRGRVTASQQDFTEVLATWPHALGIVDGVTEGMSLDGLDPLDNGDVAKWYRAVPKRVSGAGAAAVVIDHVVKDREGRGRYALGGVHKLNGLDGAGYTLDAVAPFAPGHTGRIRITVSKDRPGFVRGVAVERKLVGELLLTSSTDGSGLIHTEMIPAVVRDAFEPTALMEKVSRRCELYPGETKTELRRLGNSDYVDVAIKVLVERRHLEVRKEGVAHRHYVLTRYREQGDEGADGSADGATDEASRRTDEEF